MFHLYIYIFHFESILFSTHSSFHNGIQNECLEIPVFISFAKKKPWCLRLKFSLQFRSLVNWYSLKNIQQNENEVIFSSCSEAGHKKINFDIIKLWTQNMWNKMYVCIFSLYLKKKHTIIQLIIFMNLFGFANLFLLNQ